jgi:hypothetical protein
MLRVGQYLDSKNGLFRARLDADGRLCVYMIAKMTQVWLSASHIDAGALPVLSVIILVHQGMSACRSRRKERNRKK